MRETKKKKMKEWKLCCSRLFLGFLGTEMIMFYMVISLQQIFKVVWKNFTELHVIYNTPPPQKRKNKLGLSCAKLSKV